ncbi:MAG: TetR/AcrR family transcriptional regulator [Pseudomonas sp.]
MSNKLLPASGPGRPKDLAKRQAILEAAKTLFLRNGYDGSSMDAIAAEAGVSKLTVYSHFTDKETLFSAAVQAKCEEQLPELLFELTEGAPIEAVLLNIGRGFHTLINSRESVELHRVMVTQATQNPKLSQLFFDAGPQRVLNEMERLLSQADQAGKLRVANPQSAADHFFSMIKGSANFRLLIGCCGPQTGEVAERHVRDVVELFVRAYRPAES